MTRRSLETTRVSGLSVANASGKVEDGGRSKYLCFSTLTVSIWSLLCKHPPRPSRSHPQKPKLPFGPVCVVAIKSHTKLKEVDKGISCASCFQGTSSLSTITSPAAPDASALRAMDSNSSSVADSSEMLQVCTLLYCSLLFYNRNSFEASQ